jgi:hypothetical protein
MLDPGEESAIADQFGVARDQVRLSLIDMTTVGAGSAELAGNAAAYVPVYESVY